MWIFLVSLGVLFLATIAGYLAVRVSAPEWRPEGSPGLPISLWLSTVVILAASFTMHRALAAARRGRQGELQRMLRASLLIGGSFATLQLVNWIQLLTGGLGAQSSLYAYTFYFLTALHWLHVIGGMVPLWVVSRRANRGAYGPDHYPGVLYCAMYWHFLDIVWIVLFVVLLVGA
jgi:cytochrome c oxidase subunit 3